MSQLNPNAAEFVPISSPTRNVVSPACRALIDDEVIAQSPRRATPSDIDINLPNPQDFEKEVKNRPSDVFSNGQDDDEKRLSSQEVMENLLNGRNIEDIEFHPGTPHKAGNTEEFHFGPNATPFSTPAKLLDQSEAALSTKAVLGDESSYLEGKTLDLESSFATEDSSNANPFNTCDDVCDFQSQLSKPTDPMSTSFYQDESEVNPFDLNKVQMLPDDDEFLEKQDNGNQFNDTISDLPEHNPLPQNETGDTNLICGVSKLPETPEPALQADEECILTCDFPPAKSPILMEASQAPLPLTPEPNSDEPEVISGAISPLPQENLPISKTEEDLDVCVESTAQSDLIIEPSASLSETFSQLTFSPEPTELERELAISPEPIDSELCQQTLDVLGRPESKSPTIRTPEPTEEFLCQSKSPEPVDLNKSPVPMLQPEVVEKEEKIEEFFPICQKPSEQKDVEEIQQATKDEEFFPICQKPTKQKDVIEQIQVEKEEEYFLLCSKPAESPVIKDTQFDTKLDTDDKIFQIQRELLGSGIELELDRKSDTDDQIFQIQRELLGTGVELELDRKSDTDDQISQIQRELLGTGVELITKSPEPEIERRTEAPTTELEIDLQSKSPEFEAEFQTKSFEPEIAIQANFSNHENIIQTETPEPEIEIQTKSPEPEVQVQIKSSEPEMEIQTKYPESEVEIQGKSLELEVGVQAKSPEPHIEDGAKIVEHDIQIPVDTLIETITKTPEPTGDIIEPDVKDEIKLEEASRILGPILDNLQDIQSKLVDFALDVPLLEPSVPFVCERQTVEECSLPITESPLAANEISDLSRPHEPELVKTNETVVCKTPEPVEVEIMVHESKEVIEPSDQLLMDEIQNILDAAEPTALPIESDVKSPETIEESLDSEKRDLESPMEDITSSVKDDNSLTPEIIEEAKDVSTEKELIRDSFVPLNEPSVEISKVTQETEAIIEKESVCQISSTPNTTFSEQADTESINTADINSFLERSNIPEVTSPLSSSEPFSQQIIDAALSEPLVSPAEDVIKTELIAPQYPEETTVITPAEEKKEAPAALPEVATEAETKEKVDETIVAAAVGTAAAVATTAAVAAAIKEKKTTGKPSAKLQPLTKKPSKPGQSPTKTATTKSTPTKTATATKSSILSPTKSVPSKTAKAPTPKPAAIQKSTTKPLTKPKTETTATKTIEKKHATMNGDIKPPAPIKKPSTVTARTSLTAKSPVAPKSSPIKSETKTTVATSRTSTTRTSLTNTTSRLTAGTATTKTTTAAPKPRPTSLSSRSTGSSTTTKPSPTVSATKTTVQSKVSTTASSPPKSTTTKLKPPTSLVSKSPTASAASRSRLLMTKTKEPDTEKQMKESVNKQLTATSRTTIMKTAGMLSAGKTTTVKKTETKSPSSRTTTTTKTTVTTLKSTSKKPTEITRIVAKKTAPTKTTTIKAQQNGLTNGVTTTTIVQETTTILATEPQLIKDLSPVENKLIIDNQLSETNVAD